ncbi:MAG: 23S rRNA (uracil(1939)-C(5))-methyltransferase RlmD [Clostridiales bacterium]|uniref:23S rRNA (uracil(1939)-C(5))-methyltransferase RlmD n=1 Tax=Terrisporobacter sp. TaxID=1965305 RepID=UPI002A3B494D|nr:23S rRNA (uracil(1939)-C(5))-methyltransferase RlmD [Terrisporobacter sp.]MCI5630730.1 23S rRNA (uracil(1939)-C(5))-methyltransferase RlmD [Clostridium sp.]MDD5878228.1 23S rRNA (uracil(1939)-C(5))-methyltransferase RlmD [Clostridiales bacterium]MCI6456826.1 23S rRNA (uracil(1939)-C(5))-methyltransferase RlmD [Clostridium sp.]MCI7205438.1 23S rRNA (uracil(1939)-C(5))-methyltransferase RlmD [Clostridium sp.]MDD7756161.1 23S rRNA (uracil(1939)-C(5))-methyltransferase RlmD [Clostridiales bacte
MLSKDKMYVVDIVDIGQGGVGIGKFEGFTVFVDGGLVKDKIKVKITKSKKNYAVGDIVEIIEPSPYRVERKCSKELKDCGGCQIQELDYQEQLNIKTNEVKQVISRIGKLEDVVVHPALGMEEPFRYRNKAQFPIQKVDGSPVIGFYKKKSHDIIPTDQCIIQHDVNDKIIKIIKTYIRAYKVSVYDEKTHTGVLRHLVTKVGFTSKEVMVVLVANGRKLPYLNELASVLKENIPGFKTLVVNVNREKTNVILGNENRVIYGDGKINDNIGDLVFEISPLSFFQVNPVQTEVLYNKALEYAALGENDTVFDIYCGIGTISLFLAQRAKKVYGIEIVEEAIKDAKRNAEINNLDNVEFYVGKAEDVVPKMYKQGKRANVVVVDPPRKGCDEKVLDTIVSMQPDRVVYVSCNPSTLARDLAYLNEKGYKSLEVQPVDMFPHSVHIENVALIVKDK